MRKAKKFLAYVFSICACMIMAVSFTACADKEPEEEPAPTEEGKPAPTEEGKPTPTEEEKPTPTEEEKPTPTEEEKPTPTEAEKPTPTEAEPALESGKEFKTVKEYVDSEEVQAELAAQIEIYQGQGLTLEVVADDSTLTYIYTYNVVMQPSDELTAAFDAEVAKVEDTMDDMIHQLSELVEAENPSIVFRYYSADGTELYSREFKKGQPVQGNNVLENNIPESGKEFKTVKEYLDSDEVQQELEAQKKIYESSGMTLEVVADDSSLTYKYTYDVVMESSDELTAAFDAEVAKVKDTMDDMIRQLSELVEVENPSIVFRYYSADGTELYSCEFQ